MGYGGKTAVALADLIDKSTSFAGFKGVILNGADVDPLVQNNNFDGMFYSAGLVDRYYRDSLSWYQNEFLRALMSRNGSAAYNSYHFLAENKTNLDKFVAGVRISNFRELDSVFDNTWAVFLNNSRANLSTTESFIEYNDSLHQAYRYDIISSYGNKLKDLLNSGKRVMMLNGQNDLSVGPASMQVLANSLLWRNARSWRATSK